MAQEVSEGRATDTGRRDITNLLRGPARVSRETHDRGDADLMKIIV